MKMPPKPESPVLRPQEGVQKQVEVLKMARQPLTLARVLLLFLEKYRRFFLLSALFLFLLLLGYSAFSPPPYKASAFLFLSQIKPQVSFDTRISVRSQEDLPMPSQQRTDSRRLGIIQLIRTSAVAEEVIRELGDRLEPRDRIPDQLLGRVKVQPVRSSDLIEIAVKAPRAEYAALLATTWAKVAERSINTLFNSTRIEPFSPLKAEQEKAYDEYLKAHKEVQEYLKTSQLDLLEKKLKFQEEEVNRLLQEQLNMMASMISQANELYKTRVAELLGQALTLNNMLPLQFLDERMQKISRLYGMKLQYESTLKSLENFVSYLRTTSEFDPLSTQYTLLLLKASVYAGGSGSTQFQLSGAPSLGSPLTRELALKEVEGMLRSLTEQRNEVSAELEKEKSALSSFHIPPDLFVTLENSPYALEVLKQQEKILGEIQRLSGKVFSLNLVPEYLRAKIQELKELRMRIENETIRQRELTQKRDLAWEAYVTITRKLQEVRVAEGTSSVEVKLASEASVPSQRTIGIPILLALIAFSSLILAFFATLGKLLWDHRSEVIGLLEPFEGSSPTPAIERGAAEPQTARESMELTPGVAAHSSELTPR